MNERVSFFYLFATSHFISRWKEYITNSKIIIWHCIYRGSLEQ